MTLSLTINHGVSKGNTPTKICKCRCSYCSVADTEGRKSYTHFATETWWLKRQRGLGYLTQIVLTLESDVRAVVKLIHPREMRKEQERV